MPDCKNDKDPCDVLPIAGEAWNVCLPWGGRIWSDGNGVHANGGIAPPDGVYDKVVIADGCLVGVESGDVAIYQGAPCASQPAGCEASAVSILANAPASYAGVMISDVFIEAGANVEVRGGGTEQDPYVISADTGIYVMSENYAIAVSGKGTRQDPVIVKHKLGHAATINGMTFDAFGHLTDANDSPTAGAKGVVGIIPDYGIKVTPDPATGIVKVGVQPPPNPVKLTAQLGAYSTDIDEIGRVAAIKQTINLEAATLTCGATDIGVSPTGSITGYAVSPDTGASYLCVWEKPVEPADRRSATFTLRVGTQLVGTCITEAEAKDFAFFLDGQPCGSIGNMFWGSGVYMAGQHTLEVVPAPDAAMAVLVQATALADETW